MSDAAAVDCREDGLNPGEQVAISHLVEGLRRHHLHNREVRSELWVGRSGRCRAGVDAHAYREKASTTVCNRRRSDGGNSYLFHHSMSSVNRRAIDGHLKFGVKARSLDSRDLLTAIGQDNTLGAASSFLDARLQGQRFGPARTGSLTATSGCKPFPFHSAGKRERPDCKRVFLLKQARRKILWIFTSSLTSYFSLTQVDHLKY